MKELRKVFTSSVQRQKVERLLKKSPSPALAETNLLRLIESGGVKPIQKLRKDDLTALGRLLGGSGFLSEILIRQGEKWPDLFLRQIKVPQKTASEHLAELAPALKESRSLDEFSRALRRHKQREYLRFGARDLSPLASMEDTVREVTALADGSLEAAYRFGRAETEKEFGTLLLPNHQTPNRLAILGMGKLGGEELNFSSDIDVIFIYEDDEGESSGGRKGKVNPREFFSAVGEKIIHAMGEVTEDGFVFRIDLRLRPLGNNGPLVQSVSSALLYYESWGQCWERAALIKARTAAGDEKLGSRFLDDIRPFIYRRYLDFTTVEELRHMKSRIENELLDARGKERNLKLGYGGIREIEFFAQALQLVNGGYEPDIRERNTLRALERLARHGFIPPQEQRKLAKAYRFLRDVEHKVQIVQEAHSHTIPQGEEEERALARRLGYAKKQKKSERELFWRDYRVHTGAVRSAFDRLFYGAQKKMASDAGSGPETVWNDLDQEELILKDLKELGFADPAKAYENLLAVRDGEIYAPPSPRRLKVMRALGPALVSEVAKSASPDRALLNLAQFSHRLGGRTGFLSLLAENPETMRLLITFFADSQYLTDLFLNRPELLDSLIRVDLTRPAKTINEMLGELQSSLGEREDLEDKLNSLRRYKSEEFIRIGLHDLGREIELEQVLRQLSDLADVCVEGALGLAFHEMESSLGKIPEGRFAVVGMGKIGGKEIDYNSDLDLVFIYDAPEEARSEGGSQERVPAHDYYVRLGQKLITFLSAPTEEGIAYRIDMQLRPSGKAGPLVTSLAAFRHYHETSSQLWERQALIKLRSVAGDRRLGKEAEEVADEFAYIGGLPPEGIAEIHHLRMRMEKELAGEDLNRFNLKKGRGGLVDIEFLAQMLQLTHGHRHAELRCRETMAALSALHQQRIINKAEYRLLAEGYLFLRRLDHRLRLQRDQSIDAFEREPDKLDGIAQALGFSSGKKGPKSGQKLLRDYERRREKVRACYEKYFLTD